MSNKTLFVAALAAAAVFTVPSISHAGTGCKSTWTKAQEKLDKYFAPVSSLVCKKLHTESEEDAQKCIDDLAKYAAQAKKMKKEWNNDGNWTIGPRALPTAKVQSGKLLTERQFVGEPVLADSYTVKIDRTGGKAKKAMVVKICMVDADGDDVRQKTVRLSKGKTSQTVTFDNVAGTMALIHLNNERWGANAHQYKIKTTTSGEPRAVSQAKRTLAAAKKRKGTGKPSGKPGKSGKLGKSSKRGSKNR